MIDGEFGRFGVEGLAVVKFDARSGLIVTVLPSAEVECGASWHHIQILVDVKQLVAEQAKTMRPT
jgi:hypothetical protein